MQDRKGLMERLGYHFQDASLLEHALTHPSYSNEKGDPKENSNQRLEFLGDAVLELCSSEFLFDRVPVMQEGEMTKLRASLVCEPTLAEAARRIRLSGEILLGRGEEREGIQHRDSVLSDTFEAVIGAMYLDGGMEPARRFVKDMVLSDVERAGLFRDAKTMLQEYCSQERKELVYRLVEESGPCHNPSFRVAAEIDGSRFGLAEGPSKKKAEQRAAYQALIKIKEDTGYVFKIY